MLSLAAKKIAVSLTYLDIAITYCVAHPYSLSHDPHSSPKIGLFVYSAYAAADIMDQLKNK